MPLQDIVGLGFRKFSASVSGSGLLPPALSGASRTVSDSAPPEEKGIWQAWPTLLARGLSLIREALQIHPPGPEKRMLRRATLVDDAHSHGWTLAGMGYSNRL